MSLRSTLLVLAVLFGGQTLSAQSQPGLTFDVYTRNGSSDTTSNVAHMKATQTAARMDFEKRPAGGQFRGLPLGDHGAVIIRGSGAEIIIIDPDKKQYMSIKPLEMMEGARKMMESMGGSMTFDSAGSSFQVDSLGPGPTIDGHSTLRYRMTGRTRVHLAMMGQEQTIETQTVAELTNAIDLAEYANTLGQPSSAREMIQTLAQSVGLPKSFLDQATAAARRMKGFPLHTERLTTATTANGSRVRNEITDTKNIRRASISDSAFAIPADYKQMPLPFGRPPVPPED